MKVLVLFSLVAYVLAVPLSSEWEAWKAQHSKKYESDEAELTRYEIWLSNMKYVEEHNKNADKHGFTTAMNEFSDLTGGEFAKMYNGYLSYMAKNRSGITYMKAQNVKIPTSVDWRTKGVVTGIKNQGQCGSCWAFSATGSLEGQHALKTGKLVSLSEQQLVDCSGRYGNEGCDGGLMDNAFKYIKANGGIDTENSYPYVAHDESCHFNPSNVGASDSGYVDIPTGDEKKLTSAIATVGPISVAIDASHPSFQMYSSGVYYEPSCSTTQLDHGVLAVGYGTDSGKDYYIVKNSWGTGWGMDGYIWMSRNKDNNCGIATAASYPTV